MDNRAAATSQKWQRCRRSKVAKRQGGGVLYLLLSGGTSAGTNFTSKNQYKITKSTICAPLEGMFALLVQKTLPEVQKFQLFGNL